MKCAYDGKGHGACFPEETTSEATFILGHFDENDNDVVVMEELLALCGRHLEEFASEFMRRLTEAALTEEG